MRTGWVELARLAPALPVSNLCLCGSRHSHDPQDSCGFRGGGLRQTSHNSPAKTSSFLPWSLRYDVAMQVATGTVIDGKVVLDGVIPPEGALVTVLSSDTEASVRRSPTEEADLMAALDEADREAGTAADEVLERLRKFG